MTSAVNAQNFKSYRPQLYAAEGLFKPENYNINVTDFKTSWLALSRVQLLTRLSWAASDFENIVPRTTADLNQINRCSDLTSPAHIRCVFKVDEKPYSAAGGKVCMQIERRTSTIHVGRSGTFPESVGELNHLMAIKGWRQWVDEKPLGVKTIWDGFRARIRAEIKSPL